MIQELGQEASDEETVKAITDYFPDVTIEEFKTLTETVYNGKLKLNLNFENKEAEYFIIADTYLMLADLVSLYNHLSGKKEKDISVSLALRVKNEFLQSVEYFKDKYEWIYNPPTIGAAGKYTIGKQLRTEFVEHYGVYAEITYLLSGGNALDFDKVNKMKLSDYLSLGEYLLRKRTVENVE